MKRRLALLLAVCAAIGVPLGLAITNTAGGGIPVNVTAPGAPTHAKAGLVGLVTPAVGQLLHSSNGTWTNSPSGFTYQWEQCNSSGSSCTNESGATASTYTTVTGDIGHTIRVVVTAANSFGSASQTSAQTGVVVAPTGVGTGASLAECRVGGVASGALTSCTTPSTTQSTINVSSTGSGCTSNQCPIQIFVPGNLVTNNPSKPVPLVVVFPDSTSIMAGGGTNCSSGTCSGMEAWIAYAANPTAKFIVVKTCITTSSCTPIDTEEGGGSGGSQAIMEASVISYMEAHYSIDTTRIFGTGGSKGGNAAFESTCNTAVSGEFAGVSIFSAGVAAGSAASNPPFAGQGGNCGAFVNHGTWTIAASPPKMMVQYVWSPTDTATRNGCWSPGGACSGSTGTWYYSTDQIFAGAGLPSGDNGIYAPGLGCSRTPVQNTYDSVSGGTGQLLSKTYEGCSATLSGGAHAEAQSVQYTVSNGLTTCHFASCTQTQGSFSFNIATEAWAFWTTGTTTPQ